MADLELNSIGNGDGTNYLVRDNTKIPLSGTNALAGSIVPATDNSIDIGSSTNNIKALYTKGITIDGTQFLPSNYIPRSGGAVMTGNVFSRTVDSSSLRFDAGTNFAKGASIELSGKDVQTYNEKGRIYLHTANGLLGQDMLLYADGTWTWSGTACQVVSDQRLKQQIAEIDDKLLDAWEDVNLVQFKYNDAVKEKSDNARLHTGFVVQQIDKACKKHNVDVSKYGLYCHEEYAEETREVEHEDGTKTVEVVRPANEHYSLRYTEALIVECAYLRKKNKDLQEQLNALSERLEKLENR